MYSIICTAISYFQILRSSTGFKEGKEGRPYKSCSGSIKSYSILENTKTFQVIKGLNVILSGERDNSVRLFLFSMLKEEMKLIASSEGVNIYCPVDGKFSFFNSPYPAHPSYTGIDVYPKRDFSKFAPSPVVGEVTNIRRVKCPQGKDFKGSSYDYVILFRSLENSKRWIKILHIKPLVKVGDIVEPGEDLGTLLRSGFFNFWTDPHIHVEVRKPSDAIRARGGLRFERLMEVDALKVARELSGTVIKSNPEYSLVALNEKFKHGIPIDLNGQVGLLDTGIPHYRWVGVHTDSNPSLGGDIRLCGRKIGTVNSTHCNTCIAECCNLILS